MENFLLSKSSTDDFVFSANKRGVPDGILSADDIRRDVAIFARLLIRVYVGWPMHDEITKMRILKHLINIYNDAHEISAGEFFKLLKPVVADIPDNHISIRFGTIRFGTKYKKPYKNVGKNIAGNKIVRGEMRDGGVAAIGFSAMIKSDEFKNAIVDFAKNILPKSNALIMDLRGNTGGDSWYSDLFAEHLCGAWIDSMQAVYVRTNRDAKEFLSVVYPTAPWAKLPESEELGIDAQIGGLITIAKHTTDSGKVIELHTYEIKSYTGEIQLRVHDDMHWVPVADLPSHPQLPADLIVSDILNLFCVSSL